MSDRTVHGSGLNDRGDRYHVVRYDRSGKWWIEYIDGGRQPTSLNGAVTASDVAYLGKPGGRMFDARWLNHDRPTAHHRHHRRAHVMSGTEVGRGEGGVVEAITARLDAWEAAAKAAYEADGHWESYALPDAGPNSWQMRGVGIPDDEMGHRIETMFVDDADHIALNDPAAVLAMVAGLRTVVALHEYNFGEERWCDACGVAWPCPTLTAIAAMFPDPSPAAPSEGAAGTEVGGA